MDVGIIGSGVAGMSAAICLASKGYKVQVFEANSSPGGKLRESLIQGYRFDLGPSLLTIPNWIDDLFIQAGKDPRGYFNYHKLDYICNYFFEDGVKFRSSSNIGLFKEELMKNNIDISNIDNFLSRSKFIFDSTEKIFLKNSLHKISSYLDVNVFKSVFKLPFLNIQESMWQMISNYFTDPHLKQYFARMATYNGSNPYLAPGTLNLIAHVEHGIGAFFPEGGMYSITKSMFKLSEELGVRYHFNANVDEILVDQRWSDRQGKRVWGIRLGENKIAFDLVISNSDIYKTYSRLIPNEMIPKKVINAEKSTSALIFYWGVKREFKELGLHNILFSSNYKEEFDNLFKSKTISEDPTIYINITSKECHSDAPLGCENWFVMINVPCNIGQNWDELKRTAKVKIMGKIHRALGVDISDYIEVEEVLDPVLIEQNTSSLGGSIYGNASNSKWAAFLRHPNFSKHINGLYFCGGSVHPGGGIPLAVQSGRIVSKLIN